MSRAAMHTALVVGVSIVLVGITWLVFAPPLWRMLVSAAVGMAVVGVVLWRRREREP